MKTALEVLRDLNACQSGIDEVNADEVAAAMGIDPDAVTT